jgi:hypothetical protein
VDAEGNVVRNTDGSVAYVVDEELPPGYEGKGSQADELLKYKNLFSNDGLGEGLGRMADAVAEQNRAMPDVIREAVQAAAANGGAQESAAMARLESRLEYSDELRKERDKLWEERLALRDRGAGGLQRPAEDYMIETMGQQGLQFYGKHLEGRDRLAERVVSALEFGVGMKGAQGRHRRGPQLGDEDLLEVAAELDAVEQRDARKARTAGAPVVLGATRPAPPVVRSAPVITVPAVDVEPVVVEPTPPGALLLDEEPVPEPAGPVGPVVSVPAHEPVEAEAVVRTAVAPRAKAKAEAEAEAAGVGKVKRKRGRPPGSGKKAKPTPASAEQQGAA